MWEAVLRGKSVGNEILKNFKPPVFTGKTDTFQSDVRDEARHGKAFAGLLKRYFGK